MKSFHDLEECEDADFDIKEQKNWFWLSIEENFNRAEVSNSYKLQNISAEYHRKHKITVSNGWDVFKVINFISYMPDNFSSTIKRTRTGDFDKLLLIEENNKTIFEIYLTNGLQRQEIYIKNHTEWIKSFKNFYYVKKQPWSIDKPEFHPLVQFGKHFGRSDISPSQILSAAFNGIFKRPRLPGDSKNKMSTEERLNQLLEELPGYVEIVKQGNVKGALQLSNDHVLQRITWVCAWSAEILKKSQYIQLDTSFKATAPYCYCCVNSIINNESVTVAITVGMSENSDIYENTYNAIERFIPREKLNSLPVLSDMGTGLISFCSGRGIKQFFCHRHILERFGHKVLRNWVQRLLECTTEQQYIILAVQISVEMDIWCSQQVDSKQVPEKIKDIRSMIDYGSDHPIYNFEKWAIWIRSPLHIARCTNHSEGLHRVMNSKCKFYYDFITRLCIIFKTIIRRFTNQNESHGRSLKSRYSKFLVTVKNFEAMGYDLKNYSQSECSCGWNSYYTNLYGTRFPCIHEILNESFLKCPNPPPLVIMEYSPGNKLVNITSSTIQQIPRNKNEEKSIAPKIFLSHDEDEHQIQVKTKGENTKRSLKEFWKVVREIRQMYGINQMNAIDIAMLSFHEWGLMEEETVSTDNIAHFRIECWGKAEKISLNSKQTR